MTLNWEDVLKVVLAIIAGGLIGIEREFRDKAAGFRTLIVICVGATLFTMWSSPLAGQTDPRIAAGVVAGVGFLGAGVILREQGQVTGLTTASLIWLAAAVGMGIGGGFYLLSGVVVFLVLVVLWLFPLAEDVVKHIQDERTYEVVCHFGSPKCAEVEALFRASGQRVKRVHQVRSGDTLTTTWQVSGLPRTHDDVAQRLLADTELLEVRY